MHTWTWLYTILAFVLLLVVFAVCGLVLLLRRWPFRRRWHETRGSRSTPYGQLGYGDMHTQKMLAQGVERARHRNYVNPRRIR